MPLIIERIRFAAAPPEIGLVRDRLQRATGLPVRIQGGGRVAELVFDTSRDGVPPQKVAYRAGTGEVVLSCVADLLHEYPNYFLMAAAHALTALGGSGGEELPGYARLSWEEWKGLHGGKVFPRWKSYLAAALLLWPVWLTVTIVAGVVILVWR